MRIKIITATLALVVSFTLRAQLKVIPNGNVGVGVTNPTEKLHVNGGVEATSYSGLSIFPDNNATPSYIIGSSAGKIDFWYYGVGHHTLVAKQFATISDFNLKEDIKPLSSNTISQLTKIKSVSYRFKNQTPTLNNVANKREFGFIAQEVEKVYPDFVVSTTTGQKAINYTAFIPVLVESIKEQQLIIDSLTNSIKNLQSEMMLTRVDIDDCCNAKSNTSNSESIESIHNSGENILFQNAPNPFSERTAIKYSIDEGMSSAQIMIFDMNGITKRTLPITESGNGEAIIEGNELVSGMYLYSLIVDGQEVDTKRMILVD